MGGSVGVVQLIRRESLGVGADPAGQVTASFSVPRRARSEENKSVAKYNHFRRKMSNFGKKGDPILGAMVCPDR